MRGTSDSAEKPCRSPSTALRTNGNALDRIEKFPFMLSLIEAFLSFSRIVSLA